ncbi:hypothetical protein EDB86DRAFT_2830756 [Lactarius hatsudake]|nr:hypothetical protein EDB86DRAFT_2830756 [Lactarius hatsudake]
MPSNSKAPLEFAPSAITGPLRAVGSGYNSSAVRSSARGSAYSSVKGVPVDQLMTEPTRNEDTRNEAATSSDAASRYPQHSRRVFAVLAVHSQMTASYYGRSKFVQIENNDKPK